MDPLVAGLLALAAAGMRNGSHAALDAVIYTALFWTWVIAAALMLVF